MPVAWEGVVHGSRARQPGEPRSASSTEPGEREPPPRGRERGPGDAGVAAGWGVGDLVHQDLLWEGERRPLTRQPGLQDQSPEMASMRWEVTAAASSAWSRSFWSA